MAQILNKSHTVITILLLAIAPGCERDESAKTPPAVLYTSVDEAFAKQVVAEYEKRTGRSVRLVGDTEAGKTTGLVQRIRMERERPRGDVFWSGEQSQTVLLAREGLLAPYDSPAAADIPGEFRDEGHLWTGIALRARVVAYDPRKVSAEELPTTWEQLAEERFASTCAMANPLFGTTRGHVGAMRALWGDERFADYCRKLKAHGVRVVDGNSTAVRRILSGEVKFAMTDSDDVIVVQKKGQALDMVYPDMGDGGTMVIPNTVALLKGAPHPDAAKALIDFLLSPAVETMLYQSESGNYPVRAKLCEELQVKVPAASTVRPDAIADHTEPAVQTCRDILLK